MVKNLPAMRETGVRSLDWDDPLEKGVGPGEFHGQRNLMRYIQSMGSQRVGHNFHFHLQ